MLKMICRQESALPNIFIEQKTDKKGVDHGLGSHDQLILRVLYNNHHVAFVPTFYNRDMAFCIASSAEFLIFLFTESFPLESNTFTSAV
jgi:hypothetical protein